ncbi:hypothetical protein ACO0QE_004160 [Hanseniaspora vineae]
MSHFKVPLSAEETGVYQNNFNKLDPEGLSIVTGENARPLFAKTGLSNDMLAEIWKFGDFDNTGYLTFDQFAICCRLIGYCQSKGGNTNGIPLSPANYEIFTKLPQFGSANYSVSSPRMQSPMVQRQTSSSSFASNNQSIPVPSAMDIAKYSQLFDRSSNGQPVLNGDTARDIFMKAKLPTPTLGAIWEVCDQNQSGSLDKPQFTMAMYLIQLFMSNSITSLPPVLPPNLWQAVQAPQPQQPQKPSSPYMRTVSNQNTGNSLDRQSSMIKRTFNTSSSNWTLSADKKRNFDAIFDSMDKSHEGKLGSGVLVPFFLNSKLSQDTLATIWDLADIQNNAEFTKLEFAIAMFLIQKKNAGEELPDIIPEELLNSPALGLNGNQQAPPPQQQQQQAEPAIPNRNSKPTFDQPPPVAPAVQQSNTGTNSPLDDLLGLDNSSFSPAAPAPHVNNNPLSAASTGNSGNNAPSPLLTSTNTGLRKFKPSSTFGQSIIKEEPEQEQNFAQTNINPAAAGAAAGVVAGVAAGTAAVSNAASKPAYQSSLPNVPNFANIGLPSMSGSPSSPQNATNTTTTTSRNVNPSLDSADSGFRLSQATTDLANLSNQVRSMSNQSSILNDRKARNEQELQRVNATKANIEAKLATLRASYQQETQQSERVESLLAQSKQEVTTLTEQLNVAEANYHAVELKLQDVQNQLVEIENSNSQIKEKIGGFNSMTQSLQADLESKQAELQQKQSMLGINEKQLEVSQLNATSLQKEIAELESHFNVFVSKKKELDDYSTNIEKQHAMLGEKHQAFVDKSKELETKTSELDQREEDIKARTAQIEEQEKLYHEHIAQLQNMFDHLNSEKQKLDSANADLENQQYEYASRVQELAEKQMQLAMGHMPSNEEIATLQNTVADKKLNGQATKKTVVTEEFPAAEVATPTRTVASVTEKSEDVFDATKSATEATSINDHDASNTMILPDDTNLEDVPKHTSTTSSTLNNPPQSETLDHDNLNDEIPGHWGAGKPAGAVAGQNEEDEEQIADENASFNSIQKSPKLSQGESLSAAAPADQTVVSTVETVKDAPVAHEAKAVPSSNNTNIDEEFPPIRELEQDESDSSDEDEEEFRDAFPAKQEPPHNFTTSSTPLKQKDEFTPAVSANQEPPQSFSTTSVPAKKEVVDEFKDFDDLQQAKVDEGFDDDDDEENEVPTGAVEDSFTSAAVPAPSAPASASIPENSEWNQLFSGLEKPIAHPLPQTPASPPATPLKQTAVPMKIATTPKSLAVEELCSMGFSENEAKKALESCNWDLDTATNFLLDA